MIVASTKGSLAEPLRASRHIDLGRGKRSEVSLVAYRDGSGVVEVYSRNGHWTEGLRARTFAVLSDARGRALYITPVFHSRTCGAKGDPFTPSQRRDTFTFKAPEFVAPLVTGAEIYGADGDRLTSLHDHWMAVARRALQDAKELSAEARRVAIGVLGK